MERPSFRLSDFEGPLDLLLHLINKHKLDILDIEISELLRQYTGFLEQREDTDLEVQSEFLEMAARLLHIKTVMLLPRHEEEANDLRAALSGELMEYRLCREAAALLSEMQRGHEVYVRAPAVLGDNPLYALTHPMSALREAIARQDGRALRRRPIAPGTFSGIVRRHVVSVASRIIHLLRRLYREPDIAFASLFTPEGGRSEWVATFLALLELIKGGRVTMSEEGGLLLSTARARASNVEVSG